MPRDSTTLTFVIVGDETPIYECEIKAGAKVTAGTRNTSPHIIPDPTLLTFRLISPALSARTR